MAYKGSFYYDDYDLDHYDDSFEYSYDDQLPSFELSDILSCGSTVLKQILKQISYLLVINLIYRVIRQTVSLREFLKHLSSSLLGWLSTFIFFSTGNFYVLLLNFASYGFLKLLQIYQVKRQGLATIVFQIITIFTCEIIERETTTWQNLRGSALIISMKAISLAYDITSNKLNKLPSIYEYTGYMLCPANLVLGPFVSFLTYKHMAKGMRFSIRHFLHVLVNSFLSIVFIFLSACFLNYLIADDARFIVTYRDAFIFRCSHYFVSFMSAAALLTSGIESKDRASSDIFGYQITRPLDIELPRSLVPVVISWNIPIHLWIKNYVFENLKRYGKFKAIVLTYLISSSLHGLQIQLAAVLLSIGIFSYVEFRLRNLLAEILDACVNANKCVLDEKGCCITKGHEYTTRHFWVKLINFTFGIFTVVLLAYLGVLLDTSVDNQNQFSFYSNLKKWYDLNFFGHIIVLIWYMMYLIAKN